jgi:ribosomal protein S18 acetylase RimI-like enzyme
MREFKGEVRPATIDDAGAIARIHVRAWQAAYTGIVPVEYLAKLSEQKRARWWREHIAQQRSVTLVAEIDGEIGGWISFGPSRDEDTMGKSEIYAVYVLPRYWFRGIGHRLLNEAEARLPHEREVTLWVLRENFRALRFYEAAGYKIDSLEKPISFGKTVLVEVRYKKSLPAEHIK